MATKRGARGTERTGGRSVPLPRVFALIPVYETALAMLDLVTAIMLYGQFAVLPSPALLLLAGA